MNFENGCVPISEWPPPDDQSLVVEIDGEKDSDQQCRKKRVKSSEEYKPCSKKTRPSCSFPTAEKHLAGWLRRNIARLKESCKFPAICNPRTVLNLAAETMEGEEELRKTLDELFMDSDAFKEDPEYCYIVATYYDKLKDNKKASEQLSKSLKAV